MSATPTVSLLSTTPVRFSSGSPSVDLGSHNRAYSSSGRISIPAPIDGEKRLQVVDRNRKVIAPDKQLFLQASGVWKEGTLAEQHGRMKDTLQHLRDRIEVLKSEEPSDASFNVLARCWKRMPNVMSIISPVNGYDTFVLNDRVTEIEAHLRSLNLLERRFLGDTNAQVGTPEYTGYVKRVWERVYRSVWAIIARLWINSHVIGTYTAQFRELEESLKTLHKKTVSRMNDYYASQMISIIADKINSKIAVAAQSKDDDILNKLFFEEQIPDDQLLKQCLRTSQINALNRSRAGQGLHKAVTIFVRDLKSPTSFKIYSLGFAAQQVKTTVVDVSPMILRSRNPNEPDPAPSFIFTPKGSDVFTAQRYGRDEFVHALGDVFGPATQEEVRDAQEQIRFVLDSASRGE